MPAAISASSTPVAITAGAITQVRRGNGLRTLSGTLVRAGEIGYTDAGPLRVPDPTLLEWPEDLAQVGLTREHELDVVRGHLVNVDVSPERIYIAARAADGPLGDAAIDEAGPGRRRAGFSFRVERPVLRPGADGIPDLIGGLVTTVGQVEVPAYNSARIDAIAAARGPQTPGTEPGSTNNRGETMTEEQTARLAELRAKQNLTPEERAELEQLVVLEHADQAAEANAGEDPPAEQAAPAEQPAAPQAVAASVPTVPTGVPRPAAPARTRARGSALDQLVAQITRGLQDARGGGSALPAISAAFSDIIHTDHTGTIEEVAWSGELWSGLEYEPVFSDLLTADTLTNWEGKGWRFEITPEMQDYAGDKAAVGSGGVTTVPSSYEAARMAVGVDIDRKFYDFPNESFVRGLLERVRESWEIKKDGKSRAYILSAAQPAGRPLEVTITAADATLTATAGVFTAGDVGKDVVGPGIPEGTTVAVFTDATHVEMSAAATATGATQVTLEYAASPTVIKAAARVSQALRNTRVGRASWIMLNDEDMFSLIDIEGDKVPAYLELWGIDPKMFRSSPFVPAGTVLGGVKQAAKLRTLPGSPIRVSAQHLANGGVDEAFFGYWAIEEHHPRGIISTSYVPA